jgi:hypothetical protein
MMITTADFKKQIAKPFGQAMRLLGYKGTGFEYAQNTDDYLFAVYIEPGRWGGSCQVDFAIHPKEIDHDYYGKKDLTKLKTYQYEFKFGLTRFASGERWKYADDEVSNLATLSEIIDTIKSKAFPLIEKFKSTPNILDQIEVSEMNDFYANWIKRTGIFVATSDLRFAWAMALIFEDKNPEKARQFARWALSKEKAGDKEWFGDKDFHRVLTKGNGA